MRALSDRQRYAMHVASRQWMRDGCGEDHAPAVICSAYLLSVVCDQLRHFDRRRPSTGGKGR